tara:strand:+ start:5768 stop:7795 length:2028 start_codon:yes stop_codon:yes gene_type:complete
MAKLVQYEERKGDNSVEEDIDGRILELLGLEDVVDFTYSEYKTLLREKMVAGRMPGQSGMSNQDVKTLTDEFKRVKGKTGIFVIKANKPTNIGGVQTSSRSKPYKETKALLPPEKEEDEVSRYALVTLPGALNNISKVLQDMNNILEAQVAVDDDDLESKKEQDLQDQRDREEREAEKKKRSSFKPTMPSIPKVEVPFVDKIFDYFKNIVLGGFAIKALKWLQDDKNQESINKFIDFITDKAPLIIGGFLALMLLPIVPTILGAVNAILGVIPLVAGVIKGLTLALVPLLPGLLIAGGALYATAALKEPMEQGMENQRVADYGADQLAKGTFTTKLRDQFGRIARPEDTERLLSDEEKMTAQLLKNYDNQLRKINKLQGELETLEGQLVRQKAYGKTDPRTIRMTEKQIADKKQQLKASIDTRAQIESSINIGGKGFEQLQREFEESNILPQTGLSKELYPTSGTGPGSISGVKARGKGNSSIDAKATAELSPEQYEELMDEVESMAPGSGGVFYEKGKTVKFPGVGSVVAGMDGGKKVLKYYDTQGFRISEDNFNKRYKKVTEENPLKPGETPTITPPKAEVEPTPTTSKEPQEEMSSAERTEAKVEKPPMQRPQTTAPEPPGTSTITAIPVTPKGGGKGSGSRGNGVEIPVVPASDSNNDNLLITRTIYNIIQ